MRQAAAIILHKEILSSWKPAQDSFVIAENSKKLIRSSLVEGMSRCGDLDIARMLARCLVGVLSRDFPHDWPSFEADLKPLFKSSQPDQRYTALLCLDALGALRQYLVGDDRDGIALTAQTFMPYVQEIADELLPAFKEPQNVPLFALHTSKVIFKTIFRMIKVHYC